MKLTWRLAPRRTLTRSEALGCFTANLSVPGAGSLAAGRPVGYPQLVLGLAGLVISLGTGIGMVRWAVANWTRLSAASNDGSFDVLLELWQHIRWPLVGIILYAIATAWAASTGWGLVSEAPKEGVPPKIG